MYGPLNNDLVGWAWETTHGLAEYQLDIVQLGRQKNSFGKRKAHRRGKTLLQLMCNAQHSVGT